MVRFLTSVRMHVIVSIILLSTAIALAAPASQGKGLSDPQIRQQRVDTLTQIAKQHKEHAIEIAKAQGFETRRQVGHTIYDLMRIDANFVYVYKTYNANAAISVAVTPIRQTALYYLDGLGQLIGVWDGGAIRSTHQELAGRVTIKESVSTIDHATHVAGTLIASGVNSSAKGMSPAARVDSYDFDSDLAEMTGRAMSTPGEAGMLQISNHSYGFVVGWDYYYSPPRWYGTWGNDEAELFGQYNSDAQDWDDLCYSAPYYLPFKSAGNDRNDNAPSTGSAFQYYSAPLWRTAYYDPSIHPKSDGWDQGGYDTISAVGNAKNIMTVGAVNDAVSSGQRNLGNATMTSFSCWGPTDDGRIKPDIVANGAYLYSSLASSDTSYASYSGTSMSSPNACGAAALLLQHYANLFPGQYMRASTLKGLILHTADDIGPAGPDYRNGFGLMNTQAAADLLTMAADFPERAILVEDVVNDTQTTQTYTINYDGSGPIKATLCWTDPPGPVQSALDSTTPILVNDLDLRLTDPSGTVIYEPYILDPANPTAAAITGDNFRDNVEQISIAAHPAAGHYTLTVSYKGTLTDGLQNYALVITGQSQAMQPPQAFNVSSATDFDTPITLTLDATDDGQPGPLDYLITSLPNHGTLTDPGAEMISSVPYTLAAGGNEVLYTPRFGCGAPANFTYIANDGGVAPDGGDSNEAFVNIDIAPEQSIIYAADMSTDPNWTYEGGWAWGTPAGLGGQKGYPDPTSGFSGSDVVGYNLQGDYETSLTPTQWVTTSPIDCNDYTGVTLEFYRWLNVDSVDNDGAFIEVSNDGVIWTMIWQNDQKITDSSWTLQTFDISAIADNQPTVYIRWGMGPTNNNQNYSGWNIDDVTVTGMGTLPPPLAGDFEPDCDVDVDDLMRLVAYWLASCGDCDGTDLIADGIVNLSDFQVLAENWLAGL